MNGLSDNRAIDTGFQRDSEFVTAVIDKIAIIETCSHKIIDQLGLMNRIKFPDRLKLKNYTFFNKYICPKIAYLFSFIPDRNGNLFFRINSSVS